MSESFEEGFWSHAFQIILAAAFGAWAWVVKMAAREHLESQKRIEGKVDKLAERVSNIEGRMGRNHEFEEY